MHSMTGYGRGQCRRDGCTVTVELSAVNRKQPDFRFLLPRDLAWLEARLRPQVQERITRGAVTVVFACELAPERRRAQVRVNAELAAAVVLRLREAARSAGISEEVRIGELLAVPGIIEDAGGATADDTVAGTAAEALRLALDALRQMQEREGAALARDMVARLAVLAGLLDEIRGLADGALIQYRERLRERLRLLALDFGPDDDRLAREIAFTAERADVHEEMTRLASHLAQYRDLLAAAPQPAGRNLDFLCQEMAREINTLAAKTPDTTISRHALAFKADLDRLREQVQNVE